MRVCGSLGFSAHFCLPSWGLDPVMSSHTLPLCQSSIVPTPNLQNSCPQVGLPSCGSLSLILFLGCKLHQAFSADFLLLCNSTFPPPTPCDLYLPSAVIFLLQLCTTPTFVLPSSLLSELDLLTLINHLVVSLIFILKHIKSTHS